jgi:HPt (histidine-containing phosphotransfer) domain-containing protein
MEQANIEYILKLSGDDEVIKLKLIGILKYELPIEIEDYRNSMHLNKMKYAAACVHKLKHKIGVLGLEESYYTAEEHENELKKNRKNLQNKFENILTLMQDFVNEL